MKVVAYIRVSSVGQVTDGLGLDTQQRAIRAWAKREGHRLVGIVKENGRSGTIPDEERDGLVEVLSTVRSKKANAVVITSLDRLARLLHVQEAILGKVWQMGGRIFTVNGEVLRDDPEDPMRTAMRQMAGVFAQLDRSLIVKRLRNGRETKAALGGHAVGAAPYGTKAVDGELAPDASEQAVVARIHEWTRMGDTLAAIARRLNEEGVPARRGRWHPQTVKRVLTRRPLPTT